MGSIFSDSYLAFSGISLTPSQEPKMGITPNAKYIHPNYILSFWVNNYWVHCVPDFSQDFTTCSSWNPTPTGEMQ